MVERRDPKGERSEESIREQKQEGQRRVQPGRTNPSAAARALHVPEPVTDLLGSFSEQTGASFG